MQRRSALPTRDRHAAGSAAHSGRRTPGFIDYGEFSRRKRVARLEGREMDRGDSCSKQCARCDINESGLEQRLRR